MATRSTSKSAGGGGRIARLQNLVRDTSTEIKKVTWPDGQTTRNLTLLVIVMATILGIVLGGIDAIFVRLWEWIPT
jgi:preprotein translocase subunit SecE